MIKYYVRTTGERKLSDSYSQIDFELLIDKEHKPVESFIKQLEIISDSDAVLLEDDLVLCDNFKDIIENAIKNYSNQVINFYCYPREYYKTREARNFLYNQCTYYPKNLAKKIANEMKKIYKVEKTLPYDLLERKALDVLNLTHIQYRPCIVQHMNVKSLIGNGSEGRMTIYFIDYLKKLNIPYEKSCFCIYKNRLLELQKKHLKEFKEEMKAKYGVEDD